MTQTQADKKIRDAAKDQDTANLRSRALDEAIRISSGAGADRVVKDAKVFYDFLRGRK